MLNLSCGMQDLVPQPGTESGPPALGAQSLTPWIPRDVPGFFFNIYILQYSMTCGWFNLRMWNHGYEGPIVKLYLYFHLCRGLAPLTTHCSRVDRIFTELCSHH